VSRFGQGIYTLLCRLPKVESRGLGGGNSSRGEPASVDGGFGVYSRFHPAVE